MYAVKSLGILRVSREIELGGIDIHEHGAPAYHPEFAYMGHSVIPSGESTRPVSPMSDTGVSVGAGD